MFDRLNVYMNIEGGLGSAPTPQKQGGWADGQASGRNQPPATQRVAPATGALTNPIYIYIDIYIICC